MPTTNEATVAVILGNLIKRHVAEEIVALLGTSNVVKGEGARFTVYGDTREYLKENRARCFDAVKVFGCGLSNRKGIKAVAFENVPFHQVKHYMAEFTVTYV